MFRPVNSYNAGKGRWLVAWTDTSVTFVVGTEHLKFNAAYHMVLTVNCGTALVWQFASIGESTTSKTLLSLCAIILWSTWQSANGLHASEEVVDGRVVHQADEVRGVMPVL